MIKVSLTTVNFAAGIESKRTAVAPVKPEPVMATVAPPAAGPPDGASAVTTGSAPITNGADAADRVLIAVAAVSR